MYMSLSKLWEMVKDREVWCAQFMGLLRVRDNLVTERQQSWQERERLGLNLKYGKDKWGFIAKEHSEGGQCMESY